MTPSRMPPLLDIHTHHAAPQPHGLISVDITDADAVAALRAGTGQRWSVGLHPWHAGRPADTSLTALLEELAALPQVIAVGETGIDLSRRDVPLFRQVNWLARHIGLSERLGKPLVLHCVKASDILLGLRSEHRPAQPWAVHGYRGKPAAAAQLLRAGLWLSFGERFNAGTLAAMPAGRLLAETDCSEAGIDAVLASQAAARGADTAAYTALVAANAARFTARQTDPARTDA